ncbi:MAG: type II secretion system F family protein [Acidimicrobiia bacterium]
MSAVLALLLGLGVFLVFDALTTSRRPSARVLERLRVTAAGWLVAGGLGNVSPAQFAIACLGCGLGVAAIVIVLIGSTAVAMVGLVAGMYAPVAYYRSRRRTTRRARQQCWPEAIEMLAGAVRAGDTLPAAVALVVERGPAPLRPAFRTVVADHRISGDFVGALERLGIALADPTADRVVATLAIAHRVGGRELGQVLRTLGAFLREDLAVRKEIVARQSWTLVAARVAAAAPWLVLVLVASRPQGARAYDSVSGLLVLTGGAVATVVGYRLMVALGRLPEEPRVLASVGVGADGSR